MADPASSVLRRSRPRPRTTATVTGFLAVLLWSLLALLSRLAGDFPPLQMTALSFLVGGLTLLAIKPRAAVAAFRQPMPAMALGVGGLFFYHVAYFFALQHAPPVEAGLINYLWPLLIVLFSGLLPGEKISRRALLGAVLAFAGAALVITGGTGLTLDPQHLPGLLAALLAAVTWAGYSVLWRRLDSVPSAAMAGFCLITAVLAFGLHLALEPTILPETPGQWVALVVLGTGPVGLAFYLWDIGVKFGNLPLLGVASYAAPILSTTFLILGGFATFTPAIGLAALLMTTGALLAAGTR